MRKKMILSTSLLIALFSNNLFAAEQQKQIRDNIEQNVKKDIYIDMYSPAGKKILTSEKAYEEYLEQKYKFKEKQKQIIGTVAQNCKDIEILKAAVAKIILQLSEIEKSNSKINNSYNKKNGEKIKKLLQEVNQLKQEIKELKKKELKKKEKINTNIKHNKKSFIETNSKTKFEKNIVTIEKINKTKEVCVKEKKIIIDKEKIKKSYIPIRPEKTFTVAYKKGIGIYQYPILNLKSIGHLNYKDKFKGDMYTKAGWVHVKNLGWVKGYYLYPKVLQDKSVKYDKKHSALKVVKIVKYSKNKNKKEK